MSMIGPVVDEPVEETPDEPLGTELTVSLVPPFEVERIWDQVSRMLKLATDMSQGRYRLQDLKDKLMKGEFQLWIIFDPTFKIVAAITSTFTEYPQKKAAHGQFLGGERLIEWKQKFCDVFDSWARDNGCGLIEFSGRPGWGRELSEQGFREVFRTYQKDLR